MEEVTSVKRSKSLCSKPVESSQNLIDQLPECLLVEILCRLPRNSIVQCKCVSNSWSSLISKPSFNAHFLSLKKQPDSETTLMFVSTNARKTYSFTSPLEHEGVSKALRFHHAYKVVAGTCDDLVLWCARLVSNIKRYYITNPYTNQRYALPPSPRQHEDHVLVGLVRDSLHRIKVVRILHCDNESKSFTVHIFSCENLEWTQAVAPIPQGLTFEDIRKCAKSVGIVFERRLYWLLSSCHVLVLDTSVEGDPNFRFSLISKPDAGFSGPSSSSEQCLAVFRNRMSLLMFDNKHPSSMFYVWYLKGKDHDDLQWCLKDKTVLRGRGTSLHWKPLAFDPNEEDLLYAQCYYPRINPYTSFIFRCSILRRCTQEGKPIPINIGNPIPPQNRVEVFALTIPRVRLPTPVPRTVAGLCYHENTGISGRFRTWILPPPRFIRFRLTLGVLVRYSSF